MTRDSLVRACFERTASVEVAAGPSYAQPDRLLRTSGDGLGPVDVDF